MTISRSTHVADNIFIIEQSLLKIHILAVSQFSGSVVSDSVQHHGLQHARLPCPSPISKVYSNSCPSSWWCHPTISSSVVPCLQSFPVSGSFLMTQLFTSGAKVLEFHFNISPSNEYSKLISFRIDWFDLFAVQGTLKSLLQHHSSKASVLQAQPSLWSNSHIHTWLLEKKRKIKQLAWVHCFFCNFKWHSCKFINASINDLK